MTFIRQFELDQFDLMWKDLFNSTPHFSDISQKVTHPTDIYETEQGITLEVAAVGLERKDIEILTEGQVLRIKYKKLDTDNPKTMIYKGIKKGSFDVAWKIASKFNLSEITASLDKGLLIIQVPFAESQLPKKVEIN
jgi:HSP20 family molecular chaperone IbpA